MIVAALLLLPLGAASHNYPEVSLFSPLTNTHMVMNSTHTTHVPKEAHKGFAEAQRLNFCPALTASFFHSSDQLKYHVQMTPHPATNSRLAGTLGHYLTYANTKGMYSSAILEVSHKINDNMKEKELIRKGLSSLI